MKYVLGLDIGSASVGWAVCNLDKRRIEDLGVRAFEAAAIGENSPAKARREANSARRRLSRRRGRLDRAKRLFTQYGLIPDPNTMFPELVAKNTPLPDPWRLRADGLSRVLSGEELGRALYHIAKHRGFKSNRKSEKPADKQTQEQNKKMRAGAEGVRRMLTEHGYSTVGEMFYCAKDFEARKRNRERDYSHTIERCLLEEEIKALFQAQRHLGSKLACPEFETEFLTEAFNWQKPFASGDDVLRKVGLCTFEGCNGERRAPHACWTNERFNLLLKINNIDIVTDGNRRPLTDEERMQVADMAYQSEAVTFKQIRRGLDLTDEAKFAGVPFRYVKRKDGQLVEDKDLECEAKNRLYSLKAYHSLRKALPAGLWAGVKDSPDLLDGIAFALSSYKTHEDVRAYLSKMNIEADLVDYLCTDCAPNFSGVGALSLKAMRKMMPHVEQGSKYHAACAAAEYCHYNPKGDQQRSARLPLIDRGQITNPVVFRALTQARRVVNNIIARYDLPTYVNIEFARDIGMSDKKRKEIEKINEENRRANEEDAAHFRECFDADPKGEDRIKWRLFREQNAKCAYSQKPIEAALLLQPGYVEIDHILPYSRSFDNRMSNRVLVHCKENRDKGDRTPYEYLSANPKRWAAFEAWVKGTIIRDRDKRENLLKENFAARQDEWMQRSLSDTRYATAFFADFIRHHLQFADPEVKQPVRCLSGGVTALARRLWGLPPKDRGKDDLHHAMDAAVIAMLTPGRIKFITDYSKARETGRVTEIADQDTGEVYEVLRDRPFEFPPPWKGFRKELLARLSENPDEEIRRLGLDSYKDQTNLRPLIVSRMPSRKASGPIHADTIRSLREVKGKPVSVVRCKLTALTAVKLASLVDPDNNKKLYDEIRKRMAPFGDDKKAGQKAFGDPDNPLRKPTNDGSPGTVVKSVKLCSTQNAGVSVRNGIADNAKIVRTDVYRLESKKGALVYDAIPVYVWNLQQDSVPTLPGELILSLYPYDLVRVKTDDRDFIGYYRSFDCDSHRLEISWSNRSKLEDKEKWPRFTMGTITAIEKYEMGVLGEYFPVRRKPRGVANGCHLEPGEAED